MNHETPKDEVTTDAAAPSDIPAGDAEFAAGATPATAQPVPAEERDDPAPPADAAEAAEEAAVSQQIDDSVGITLPQAMERLATALLSDPSYAWSWHCNLAVSAFDEGVDRSRANRIAARFLSTLTKGELDITQHPHYAETQPAPRPEGMETPGWVRLTENSFKISNSAEFNEVAAEFWDAASRGRRASAPLVPLSFPLLWPSALAQDTDVLVTFALVDDADHPGTQHVRPFFTPIKHLRGNAF